MPDKIKPVLGLGVLLAGAVAAAAMMHQLDGGFVLGMFAGFVFAMLLAVAAA